ncbi:hypothetical protein RB653_000588 [Dictyostelium firmibasis]|uniref:Uncharacterized protein n=1 Tax=Dictyostelium firmibasis TaxID=79012 RepID=A0AAN7U2Y4_9MYCE
MIKNSLVSKYRNVFFLLSTSSLKSISPIINKNICFSTKRKSQDLTPFFPVEGHNHPNFEIIPPTFFRKHVFDLAPEVPIFLSNKIFKIVNDCLNSGDIQFIKDQLWKLHSLKVKHYLRMYSVFQKVFENIENSTTKTTNDSSKEEKLENLMDFIFSKSELRDDLISCYFYSLVNEKNKMVIEIFEKVLNKQGYKEKDYIINETIKILLEFRRVDLAIKIYQLRFIKFNLGINMDTVFAFTNHFMKKQRYKWAIIWGNQDRKKLESEHKMRINKQSSKNIDSSPSSYQRLERVYKEIYSFINNELPSIIPDFQLHPSKETNPNKFTQDYINAQKQLDLYISKRDQSGIVKILDDYFFKHNEIPHYNTLFISLLEISEHFGSNWTEQFKNAPQYILEIVNYGIEPKKLQKQTIPKLQQTETRIEQNENENEINRNEFLMNKFIPNENELIEIFKILLIQPKFEYPIKLFKMISNLKIKVKFTDMTIHHYLSYLKFYYHEINDSNLIEETLEKLSNYSSSIGYSNLMLYHLFQRFKQIQIPSNSELDEYQSTYNDLLEFYFNLPRKNYSTIDIAISIFQHRYPIKKNQSDLLSYWNQLFMNASLSNQTKLLNNRIINNLADSNKLEIIENLIQEDPFLWKELSSNVTIKYLNLYRKNGRVDEILEKFLEREIYNSYCSPELFDFISFINKDIENSEISNALQYITIKRRGVEKENGGAGSIIVQNDDNGDYIFIDDPLNEYYYQKNNIPLSPLQIENLEKILSIKNYNPSLKL